MRTALNEYGISVPRKLGTGTRKIIGISYETKQGTKITTYFNDSLKRTLRPFEHEINIETGKVIGKSYCELLVRLLKGKCEICNKEKKADEIAVHHVRKLEYLDVITKEKEIPKWVKLMKKIRRKTLIVCNDCHDNIHGCE